MSWFTKFAGAFGVGRQSSGALYYDALKSSPARRSLPSGRLKSADRKLRDQDRRLMSAKVNDLIDNMTVLSWMVNQHVNYISALNFKASTGKKNVDKALHEWFEEWSQRFNCHAQQKHSFQKLIRHIERQRVVDGDVFVLKIAGNTTQRGTIQVIEADRVRDPVEENNLNRGNQFYTSNPGDTGVATDGKYSNGVRLNRYGIPRGYALHKRTEDGGLEFEREVRATSVLHHGFFDRPDQIRGVSPLTTSLNTLEDVYEGFRLTLGKIKVSQVLGAFISRQSDIGLGAIPTEDSDGDGIRDSGFEFQFDDGINIFDLNDNESVQVVQDNSTSSETHEFLKMMIQVALKSLDIPFSFYSEDFTNWYGSRGAVIQYTRACKHKQHELMAILDEIMRWAIGMAIYDGSLVLPGNTSFEDLKWMWVPTGLPWWDPQKEVAGHKAAIEAGFTSYQRVCRENGVDFEEIMQERKEAEELADKLGVTLVTASTSSATVDAGQATGADIPEPPAPVVQQPNEDEEEESPNDETPE